MSKNCGLFEQVITGCRPFNSIAQEVVVVFKVLEGFQPDRPQSCFTDKLWELLAAIWLPEHGSQPLKRPQTSIIRDLLNEEVNNWGTLIVPPSVAENTVDDSRPFLHSRVSNVLTPEALQPPPPPRKVSATLSPFIVRTPAGSKAGEKEKQSTHNPLVTPSILMVSSKDYGLRASERGTIQPVFTGRKLVSRATGTGSSTCPRLMARDWKFLKPNLPKKT